MFADVLKFLRRYCFRQEIPPVAFDNRKQGIEETGPATNVHASLRFSFFPGTAIRDLFDLFHAVRKMKRDLDTPDFLIMVKKKLHVPGNSPVDNSLEYKGGFDRQLEGQLRPVLLPGDFNSFNMDEAFDLIERIARSLSD